MSLKSSRTLIFAIAILLFPSTRSAHAIFGTETVVLMEVVSNQLVEIQRLAESVGIAKDQQSLLIRINEGVQQSIQQIKTLDSIIERAQGLHPGSIQSLSELNNALHAAKLMTEDVQELIAIKLILCDQAVEQAGLQSDTAYLMGQEMVSVGSQLARESETASPGRSQQITASASSAQMLAKGVELQTLSQMSQLLALNLELQKTQLDQSLKQEMQRENYLKAALTDSTSLKSPHRQKVSQKRFFEKRKKLE